MVSQKKYKIIYADPPWSFNNKKTGGSMKSGADAQYATMSIDDLKQLDVKSICDEDCALVMWYVSSQPQEALDLVKAWGFTVKTMNGFIWNKLTAKGNAFFGMGFWTRAGAECALIATKGKPKTASRSVRQVINAKIGKHSEKPAAIRFAVTELFGDLPRLEMFARCAPDGWGVFGNEAPNSIEIRRKSDDY